MISTKTRPTKGTTQLTTLAYLLQRVFHAKMHISRLYLPKSLYFTNLDFPEIRQFPLLNRHLGWGHLTSVYMQIFQKQAPTLQLKGMAAWDVDLCFAHASLSSFKVQFGRFPRGVSLSKLEQTLEQNTLKLPGEKPRIKAKAIFVGFASNPATSWWLNQPLWKILVKRGIFPKLG